MVEPFRLSRLSRLAAFGLAGLLAGLLAGCSVVPRSRLDDCRKLSQTLEADKARLKDTLMTQRSQYDDLAQRADDDARRLRVQTDEVKQLRASVQAYQDERDQLASDFARVKSLLQASTNPVSTSLLQRFQGFAKEHPGCEFDPVSGILTLPSDMLFERGGDELKASARPLIKSLAGLLGDSGSGEPRMMVAGHTDDSQVRRASLEPQDGDPAPGRLGLDRATRVRDQLAHEANLDPSRIDVAGFEGAGPKTEGRDEASRSRNRRIEIHLFGPPPAARPGSGP